jgi:hypothetical protein
MRKLFLRMNIMNIWQAISESKGVGIIFSDRYNVLFWLFTLFSHSLIS